MCFQRNRIKRTLGSPPWEALQRAIPGQAAPMRPLQASRPMFRPYGTVCAEYVDYYCSIISATLEYNISPSLMFRIELSKPPYANHIGVKRHKHSFKICKHSYESQINDNSARIARLLFPCASMLSYSRTQRGPDNPMTRSWRRHCAPNTIVFRNAAWQNYGFLNLTIGGGGGDSFQPF